MSERERKKEEERVRKIGKERKKERVREGGERACMWYVSQRGLRETVEREGESEREKGV